MLCNIITKNSRILNILPKFTGCSMANKSNAISWFNNEKEAFSAAKEERKALMMMFHREWCGACKKLWPKINNDPQIQEISAQFVMLEMRNESEKTDAKYAPDGEYVPRLEIQFRFINGKSQTIINTGLTAFICLLTTE